jgi:hypothetical protein
VPDESDFQSQTVPTRFHEAKLTVPLELLQASALKECEASEDSRRSFASPLAAILSPMRRFLLIEEIM